MAQNANHSSDSHKITPTPLVSHKIPVELFFSIVNFALRPISLNSSSSTSEETRKFPKTFSTQRSTASKLSLVSTSTRLSSQRALFESPVLDRDSAKKFKQILPEAVHASTHQSSQRTNPHLSSYVKSLTFMTKKVTNRDEEHEHVSLSTILEILALTKGVERVSLDMTCGMVGCEELGGLSSKSKTKRLELKNLKELVIRCPKGYLPPGSRSFLTNHLSAPCLTTLHLLFTQPGNFQSSKTCDKLNSILEILPQIKNLNLKLVEPKEEILGSGLLSPTINDSGLPKHEFESHNLTQGQKQSTYPTREESNEGGDEVKLDEIELIKSSIRKPFYKMKTDSRISINFSSSNLIESSEDLESASEVIQASFSYGFVDSAEKFEAHHDPEWNQMVERLRRF